MMVHKHFNPKDHKMNEKLPIWLKIVFYALIATFILSMIQMLQTGPVINEMDSEIMANLRFALFIIPFILFFALGAILIFLTLKSKVKGMLRIFLLLTGGSAVGFLIFVLLHNFVYGLLIYLFGEGFWNGGDEPVFFILATMVCPIVFLVGTTGSIVLLTKKAYLKMRTKNIS